MGPVLIPVGLSIQVGFCYIPICSIPKYADYVDEEYQRLADMAREIIKNDPISSPTIMKKGFIFCTDGKECPIETLWRQMLDSIRETQPASLLNQLDTLEEVFHHLHGNDELILFYQLDRE